jgi:hypothetical protein
MEELFVLFETAIKLRDKGFNEPCMARWDKIDPTDPSTELWNRELQLYVSAGTQTTVSWQICSAPTYDQVFAWFRKKHNIKAYIDEYDQFHVPYIHKLGDFPAHREYRQKHETFEKTRNACIEFLLTLV